MRIAFVFPGQGSQAVGMMAGFDAHPAIRSTFDAASEVLGQDLWALVTEGPEADLGQTVNTQPVMLTAGVAVWRAWNEAGGAKPECVAGHSLGEYTALVAAGAIAFRDAVPARALSRRGDARSRSHRVSARWLRSSGLDAAAVAAVCADTVRAMGSGRVVEPVNFNGPEQIVIAGHKDAVERAIEAATTKGAKRGVLLPVSAPFHSSLMRPAAEKLASRLASVPIAPPVIPVLHNVRLRGAQDPRTRSATRSRVRRPLRSLGRDDSGFRRARRHARRRVRAWTRARRTQQADRARAEVVGVDRRRGPRGGDRCASLKVGSERERR
jgi:[acyl-carrier-protein] S-malonyltransferase